MEKFLANCAREMFTTKTAKAAIGSGITNAVAYGTGILNGRTAVLAVGMYVGGYIAARAEARDEAGCRPAPATPVRRKMREWFERNVTSFKP